MRGPTRVRGGLTTKEAYAVGFDSTVLRYNGKAWKDLAHRGIALVVTA